jgi:hypothetical protein
VPPSPAIWLWGKLRAMDYWSIFPFFCFFLFQYFSVLKLLSFRSFTVLLFALVHSIYRHIYSLNRKYENHREFLFSPFLPLFIFCFFFLPSLSVRRVSSFTRVFFPVSLFHFSFVCNSFPMFSRSVFFPVLVFVFGSVFFSPKKNRAKPMTLF